MLSRKTAKSLLNWKPGGNRFISMTFRTNKKGINIIITNFYILTNGKEQAENKEFFSCFFQEELDKTKQKDPTILMGNLNADRRSHWIQINSNQ